MQDSSFSESGTRQPKESSQKLSISKSRAVPKLSLVKPTHFSPVNVNLLIDTLEHQEKNLEFTLRKKLREGIFCFHRKEF